MQSESSVQSQMKSLGAFTPRAQNIIYSADENLFEQHCIEFNVPTPARRFCFSRSGGQEFISNFAFDEYDLLIDLHGVIFYGGPASSPREVAQLLNLERQQQAAQHGYIVLPFTSAQVRSHRAIESTYRLLRRLGWR